MLHKVYLTDLLLSTVNIKPFREMPKNARRLIFYYGIGMPSIVCFVIFNAYLFKLGYSVVEVGAIITLASVLTTLLLPVLGYLTDRHINAKYFLIILEILLGASFLIYGLYPSPITIFVGRVIFSSAMLFTFASNVYEKELYPKDALDDIYVWHWLIPSAFGIGAYTAAFIYFTFYPDILHIRLYYITMGLLSPLFAGYIYFALPDLPVYREKKKFKISRKILPVILVGLFSNISIFFISGLPFDNLIINHFGSTVAIIVLISAIGSVIETGSSYFKAIIPKKWWRRLPYICMLIIGIGSIIVFIIQIYINGMVMMILFVLFYMSTYFLWPLWHMSYKPLLLKVVPLNYRGTIFSIIQAIWRFTIMPLSFLAGIVIYYLGDFSPLVLSFVFSLFAVALLFYIEKM